MLRAHNENGDSKYNHQGNRKFSTPSNQKILLVIDTE